MLDDLLQYHENPPGDDFTQRVMQRVQRQQRLRRAILLGTGTIGAVFGATGVILASEPLAQLFERFSALPVSVGAALAIGIAIWLFQDEATSQ